MHAWKINKVCMPCIVIPIIKRMRVISYVIYVAMDTILQLNYCLDYCIVVDYTVSL